MIEATAITKTFGRLRALDGFSVSMAAGRSFSLIGPNGSGKTTFIKCLLGTVIPDSGTLMLDGRSLLGDPALRARQPWQAAWEQDFAWFGEAMSQHYLGDDSAMHVLLGGILALSDGQAVEQVEADARAFVNNARHPTLGIPYRNCIYQPMLELLHYLEANGFISYIVSGGGRDFMRGFAHDLYGVPRERVIGSTVAYRYVEDESGGAIVQRADLDVINDGPDKAVQIWNVIGRRPILAAGNSNGDLEMLTIAGGASLPALRLLVVHDDAAREFDYITGAEKALKTAQTHGWTTVSIKHAWRHVFPAGK